MKIVCVVCAGILALLTALLLCRVGVAVEYTDTGLGLQVRAGLLHITLLPRPEKGRRRKQRPKKETEKRKKPETEPEAHPSMMRNLLQRSGSLRQLKALLDLALDAAGNTIRHLRVEYLRLHYTFAGQPDPAKAAMECGYVNVGGDMICCLLEEYVRILERQVTAEVDFCSESARVYAAASCSIRVGAGLAVGLKLCKGYLAWKKTAAQAAQEEKTYG